MLVNRLAVVLFGTFALASCGSGATIGSNQSTSGGSSATSAPSPGTVASAAGKSPAPASTPSPTPGGVATATPTPVAATTPTPTATSAGLDLTCDNAPYPSATFVQCETTNYAMVTQSDMEQTQPAFVTPYQTQSTANQVSWAQRNVADTSWLSPLSGNTAQTPLCTEWDGPCVGDPFRYPDSAGPNGSTFYTNEANVTPFVVYDSGCARMSGRVWAPKTATPGASLPNIVIENGSVEAPETLYWWAAQPLVRAGYVVMTFDPRGQGRSDEMTPSGAQGGNINTTVFQTGLVDAIDFFRSTPSEPYPNNATCLNTYPTAVTPYNPYWNLIDRNRLGIAGHSAGAAGVSIVQGLGGMGAAPYPGKIDSTNPVKVAVAWDGLLGPAGGQVGGIGSQSTTSDPKFVARVPAMGSSSEYGLTPMAFASPPPPELHKNAFSQWVAADMPVYEFTIRGSSHYEYSPADQFPTTSWCPHPEMNECDDGWGNPMAAYYTVAWFDRWLKLPGETGYADADARLLNDNGAQGRNKMSYHFHSARFYPDRSGKLHACSDIRGGCTDTSLGSNAKRRLR